MAALIIRIRISMQTHVFVKITKEYKDVYFIFWIFYTQFLYLSCLYLLTFSYLLNMKYCMKYCTPDRNIQQAKRICICIFTKLQIWHRHSRDVGLENILRNFHWRINFCPSCTKLDFCSLKQSATQRRSG